MCLDWLLCLEATSVICMYLAELHFRGQEKCLLNKWMSVLEADSVINNLAAIIVTYSPRIGTKSGGSNVEKGQGVLCCVFVCVCVWVCGWGECCSLNVGVAIQGLGRY